MFPAPEPHLQVDEYDGELDVTACADCGHEGLVEDDRIEVEGDVTCRECALERLTGLAGTVLGRSYRKATKAEAARRLNPEFVTFRALLRELEREVGKLL